MFPLYTKRYVYDFENNTLYVSDLLGSPRVALAHGYTHEDCVRYLQTAGVLTSNGKLRSSHRPDISPVKIAVVPYNKFSRGARDLSKGLQGSKRMSRQELLQHLAALPKEQHPSIVINWGGTGSLSYPEGFNKETVSVLNPPEVVQLCSDKVAFFTKAKDVLNIPEFTTDLTEAMDWVEKGIDVLGRQSKGSCGTDIITFNDDPVEFTNRDFWVKYKKKRAEFRIHVLNGKIISEQQKVLRSTDVNGSPIDKTTVDFRIRNHRNGFIFQRNDIVIPETVREQALKAIEVVGADFGAVDVIYNAYENKGYALEVNTAPGLEGTTLTDYVTAFGELLA